MPRPARSRQSFWARLIYAGESRRFPDEAGRRMHEAALGAAAELDRLVNRLTITLSQHYAARWSPEMAFRCDLASHLQLNRYEPRRHSRELLTDAHEDGLYLTLLFADAPRVGGAEPRRSMAGAAAPPRRGDRHAGRNLLADVRLSRAAALPPRPESSRGQQSAGDDVLRQPQPDAQLRAVGIKRDQCGVDIIQRAIANPTRYGLPPLPAVQAGDGSSRLHSD